MSCLQDFEQFRPRDGGGPSAGGGGSTSSIGGMGGEPVGAGGEAGMPSVGGGGNPSVGGGGQGGVGGSGGEPVGGDGGMAGAPMGGMGGEGGSGGGCAVNERACTDGSCAPIVDDPAFGCADPDCVPCGGFANAETICVAGACALGPCDTDYDDCDVMDATGCEAHLPDDPLHCGDCSTTCPTGTCDTNECAFLCGSQPIPTTGDAVCHVLDSQSLGAGLYGTVTFARNQAAPSAPGDPYTAGCISQQPSTANDSTDPSVLCELTGVQPNDDIYFAFKGYSSNTGNPPSGFAGALCDNQNDPPGIAKCRGTLRYYRDNVLIGTFVHPPAGIFAYLDMNSGEPLQVIVNP